MITLTVKIGADVDARLRAEAKRSGKTKSQLVREALATYAPKVSGKELSCYDLSRDICGSAKGPPDLSTNPKYMEDFGL